MQPPPEPIWARIDDLGPEARFALTVGLVAVCAGARYLLNPFAPTAQAFSTLYLALVLAALIGGFWSALIATGLGALSVLPLWFDQGWASHADYRDHVLGLTLFLANGVLIGLAAETYRRARWRARRAHLRVRLMADNTPALIWLSGEDKQCTWFNRQWLNFTGRTMAEEQGSGWMEGVHPDDRQRFSEAYGRAFDARESFDIEYRLRRHDGEYRWMFDRGVPILDERHKFAGYIGSCIDIHDRREAEQRSEQLLVSERAARADAEKANKAKEEFLGIVSHELRTPLNAIVGWTFMLREQLGNHEEVRTAIAVIERNARAQARIIDDLLDMTRLMSGRLRFERTVVDLNAVARAALDGIEPAAATRGVSLQMNAAPDPVAVVGDAQRLQQLAWNLLSNAVKFTGRGGQVRLGVSSDRGQATLVVQDTGEGISAEFLPYVFDRFRQGDGSPTRRHGGLGIGLALVKGIAQHHGGTVVAESRGPGFGAIFTVTLPLATIAEIARDEPANIGTPALSGIRVLVVDDDTDTCELLSRILRECGATVISSNSVSEALDCWNGTAPDVLVSDISMPDQDGYALVREIRRKGPEDGGHTPAIALTAFGRHEDQRAALEAGFQVHLRKPLEPYDLVSAVATLARQHAA